MSEADEPAEALSTPSSSDEPQPESQLEPEAPAEVATTRQRIAAWLARRSLLTLALILQLLALAARQFVDGGLWYSAPSIGPMITGMALFLPGPLKRGDRRAAMVAVALGAVALPVLGWLQPSYGSAWRLTVAEFCWPAGVIILVGVVEWLLRPGDSWRVLGWIIALGLGFAALYAIVAFLPNRHTAIARYSWPLTAIALPILPWLVIPAAYRFAEQEPRRSLRTAGAILLALGCCVAFFQWGIYGIARRSLASPTVMDRNFAVQLLDLRGRPDDYEAIAAELVNADWSRRSSRFYVDDINVPDWRATAVSLMMRHDPEWATERLVQTLLARPSRPLIDMTEGRLVKYKRWEAAPILLRYALLESLDPSLFGTVGNDRFIVALDELGVPQAIYPWLLDEFYEQTLRRRVARMDRGDPTTVKPQDVVLRDPLRSRIGKLLRYDAGPRLIDWFDAADEQLAALPTPLSAPLAAEADRIVEAFFRYLIAKNRLRENNRSSEKPDLAAISEPNWDAPTTDAFCRELDDYIARVTAAMPPEPEASKPD